MEKYKIAKIILPFALYKDFDYSIPDGLEVNKGDRVLVDFRGRKRLGVVVNLLRKSEIKHLKSLLTVCDRKFSLTEEHLNFAEGLSNIYPYSVGEFLFMMLPSPLKKIKEFSEAGKNDPRTAEPRRESSVFSNIEKDKLATNKLFIKGSSFLNRYRVWKDIVSEKLKIGSVLVCFPQVNYLQEAKEIIERDFDGAIKVIYSQQKDKDLFMNWKEARENALILGTRVSLFYYPRDLNLIVIEEENSEYYFQEEKPFYHLLNVALLLSKIKNIDLVLSGDYPSLFTYRLIEEQKIVLREEIEPASRPIDVVDMGEFWRRKVISPLLTELIRKNMEKNKRVVVIWNRKWFGSLLSCSVCGYIFKCGECSAFLQLSLKEDKGICPYCSRKVELPKLCGQCRQGYIKSYGLGIERIEVILKQIFPEFKIDKWEDRTKDTRIILSTPKILSSLYENEIFDAGFLLDTDYFFSDIDYEATFKAFLYLKKLSLFFKDKFYVFTRNKSHYLFERLNRSWRDFYSRESALRKDLDLPPFGVIAKIVLRDKHENKLLTKAKNLYNRLGQRELEVYGPFQEKPFKLRGNFRYSIILKSKKDHLLRKILSEEIKSLRGAHTKLAAIIR